MRRTEIDDQLDTLIERFAAGSISRRGLVKGAAALGVSGAALQALQRSNIVVAQPAENSVRWVSPRGTLEVLDDYAVPGRRQDRLFRRHRDDPGAGADRGDAGTKAVDTGQADMAYPSPGVFSPDVEQGIPLVSVFEMGAYDVFDFAFPKGKAPASVKDLEGKTVVLGSAGGSDLRSEIAQAGGDHTKVNYVEPVPSGARPWPGPGGCRALLGGLRAQWVATVSTSTTSSARTGRSSRPTLRDPPLGLRGSSLADLYTRYLRGWAKGLEFGYHNPLAATQITMEAHPALNEIFQDKQIAVESMWQLAEVFRGNWDEREGWGWHLKRHGTSSSRPPSTSASSRKELKAADVITNDCVAAANDFDHDAGQGSGDLATS